MSSLNKKYLDTLVFTPKEVSTLRTIGEFQGKQTLFIKQSPEILNGLRMVAKIESSESSNRLEGIELEHKKIQELVIKDTAPTNRSEQEIAGYRDALNMIHESAENMPFSSNVILQLHGVLSRYMPNPGARWKASDNEIIETYPDGTKRIRFSPTKAFLVPQEIEKLITDYSFALNNNFDPLILIPLVILDFLCIHPFTDGNGRISRLLTLMLLYQSQYEVGRYISLERVFEETKETYYETLELCSQGWHEEQHDVKPWMNYFWGILIRAYREFEERVGVITNGKGSKTELVMAAINRRITPFSIIDLETECPNISRDMIRLVLRQMRDKGLIVVDGFGRGAKWRKVK